jgi:glycosyltransferase involved in cell wall biosynthesis
MKDPVVSVIIPVFNREKLVVKAINSVLAQTYQDFEILIIDDASTDNTEKVIRDLNNDKIKYYRLDKNSGQCIARNFGIKKSNAKYIAFLDSDDEWFPEKLKLQIDCFDTGSDKLGIVYGYAYQKDVIKDKTTLYDREYYRGSIHDKFLEGFCPPTPSLFMVKNEVLQKLNGFDENLITFVDLDMWLRISEEYEFDYVEEPIITKYEQIGDQYVNNFEKRYKGYHLFFNKWQEIVKQRVGQEGLSKLKKHLAYALVVPILEHPPKNLRRNIFKLIHLLIKIRSTRYRFYTKSILILIFGPNIIYFIRNIINRHLNS